MKVTIIGIGEIGSALTQVLKNQPGVTLTGWDKNASKLPTQITLEASLRDADIILLCLPSWNLRGALLSIAPHLKTDAGIVSLAKGIEQQSHKSADELMAELVPGHDIGILGGPMIAEDMLAGKLTAGVLASTSTKLKSLVKWAFKSSALQIQTSNDVHGTALCGVLKNTYTLGIGIVEGLGLGENANGVLFSHALNEMQIIVKLLGGKASTALGLAGAGDFYATASSPHSRNRTVGIVLGTGSDGHLESEGFMSLTCLPTLIGVNNKLPLLDCLIKIANKQASPNLLKEVIFGQRAS